jgi:Flp pilus assembly protein TadD
MSKRRRTRSATQPHSAGPASRKQELAAAKPTHTPETTDAASTSDAPLFNVSALTNPTLWIVAGLLAVTLFAYAPARHNGFVSVDDPGYLTNNPHVTAGLTASGVRWAFTTGHMANWHPVTWLSHMLDAELFGMRPGAHHVMNVIFHAANTLLLFAVLRRLTGAIGRSAFVAALFAVHPLHVESVAWLSERKDVLSTLFWLLTMWLYATYVARPHWVRYAVMLVVFALGLMAKPMLVTLPFVLLLMDWWPLGRVDGGRAVRPGVAADLKVRPTYAALIVEKLPFFALVAASIVITLIVQRQGGAVASLSRLPVDVRISNAFVSYLTYLGKTFWPLDLAAFYPYNRSLTIGWGLLALAAIAAITFAALRASRRRPYLGVGWLWYLGTLVPVIGLVQVGTQSVADRYTYVPLIGVFIVIAWGVTDLVARLPGRRLVLAGSAAAIVLASASLARAQVVTWRDGQALWEHALAVTKGNYLAHSLLGGLLGEQGKTQDALVHLRQAVAIDRAYPDAHHNLGVVLASLGKFDEAITEYRAALRLNPRMANAQLSLGLALANTERIDEAIPAFEAALALDPTLAEAHRGLGLALARRGRAAEAERHYGEAVRLDPDAADAQRKLGKSRFAEGKVEEALARYREALTLRPDFAEAHADLGFALMASGQGDAAATHLREAIRLKPGFSEAHTHLGFLLAAGGQFAEALTHFTEAVRLTPDSEVARAYRAIALHNLGRVDEARREFQEVLRLNPANEGARRGLAAIDARAGRAGRGRGR